MTDRIPSRSGDTTADRVRRPRRLTRILEKLRCTVCGSRLTMRDGDYRCERGHQWEYAPAESATLQVRRPERIFRHASLYTKRAEWLEHLNPLPKVDGWVTAQEVLDLGCGPYQYLYSPHNTALRVGIDLSADSIAAADRRYPDSIHLQGSVCEPLPFADSSFEIVLLLFVLHHLPRARVPDVIREALRVSRGQLIVYDHIRSDVAWQRRVQHAYWNAVDGGDLYRSQQEWSDLWSGFTVLESQRMGRMFGNVGFFRIASSTR